MTDFVIGDECVQKGLFQRQEIALDESGAFKVGIDRLNTTYC